MKDNQYYTSERAQQILIEVLKANNIKKVVASPGTASMSLIVSMEHDGAFEMYSSIDERSAAARDPRLGVRGSGAEGPPQRRVYRRRGGDGL